MRVILKSSDPISFSDIPLEYVNDEENQERLRKTVRENLGLDEDSEVEIRFDDSRLDKIVLLQTAVRQLTSEGEIKESLKKKIESEVLDS